MHTRIETITPEKAREYLGKNIHNRGLRKNHVEHLATEMKNGNWVVTHQGIAFGPNGDLIDGQHRMAAVVTANVPIEILVARHVSSNGKAFEAQDVIDCGAKRTTADQLSLTHGLQNANITVAAARWIATTCLNNSFPTLSVSTAQQVLSMYMDEISAVFQRVSHTNMFKRAWIVGGFAFAAKANRDEVLEVCQKVGTGEDLVKSDAALVLRNWLIDIKGSMARGDRGGLEQFFNGIYNAITGREVTRLAVGARGFDYFVGKQRKQIEIIRGIFGVDKAFVVRKKLKYKPQPSPSKTKP